MAITTAMPTSFKGELFSGGHCFGATVTTTGNTHATTTVDSIGGLSGVAVGMGVSESHGDIPAGALVKTIDSGSQIHLTDAATGSHTGGTLTFTGDIFKMVLIKHSPAGTYGAATVNFTDVSGNTDEVSGTGYTSGGTTLTNVSAVLSGTTAYVTFGGTISWTSATIDSDGCMIQNTSARLGGTSGTNAQGAGRACYVGDFGGRQTVTAGTFTVVMPTADASNAILRLA